MHDVHAASTEDGGGLSLHPPPPPAVRIEPEHVRRQLAALPGWELCDGGDAICRVFPFPSLEVADTFAHLAFAFGYEAKHYPALTVVNGMVVCRFTTLEAGGVTSKDFEMARRISLLD
jgi:pterin-4a-carbinolamine dehydratase